MNRYRFRATTAEAAYRRFVVPLSIFMIVGGMFLSVLFCFVPITSPFPFVTSERLNRIIGLMISIFLVADGIGLLLRSRVAWYALLAYCGLGVILPVLGAFDPNSWQRHGGYEMLPFGAVLNSVIAIGIYLGTRPAFVAESPETTS
jgi:hypothetical protein